MAERLGVCWLLPQSLHSRFDLKGGYLPEVGGGLQDLPQGPGRDRQRQGSSFWKDGMEALHSTGRSSTTTRKRPFKPSRRTRQRRAPLQGSKRNFRMRCKTCVRKTVTRSTSAPWPWPVRLPLAWPWLGVTLACAGEGSMG